MLAGAPWFPEANMNDLSGLTYSTLQLRMRADLFAKIPGADAAYAQRVEVFERCDECGSVVPLYQITFTGPKFMCVSCGQTISAQPAMSTRA